MDYSQTGSSVHGIFQVRILEWVDIPFSRDIPDPGIEPRCPAMQAESLLSELSGKPMIQIKNQRTGSQTTAGLQATLCQDRQSGPQGLDSTG